jgi:hypothetical protein
MNYTSISNDNGRIGQGGLFISAFVVSNIHWPAQSPRVGFVLFLDKKNQDRAIAR